MYFIFNFKPVILTLFFIEKHMYLIQLVLLTIIIEIMKK